MCKVRVQVLHQELNLAHYRMIVEVPDNKVHLVSHAMNANIKGACLPKSCTMVPFLTP